ncbi:MAG: DUF5069 domain-containing protein [Patescibacteria group bacterium]
MNNTIQSKDLSKEAPRSPYMQLGGFAILARTIDKCRAVIAGTPGEYHFDCPVDKMLFGFKNINAEDFKAFVADGHTDEEIVEWVKTHGDEKTDDEIKAWSESFRTNFSYSTNEWFIGECTRLGLDPVTNTLFDMLEVDDVASFAK